MWYHACEGQSHDNSRAQDVDRHTRVEGLRDDDACVEGWGALYEIMSDCPPLMIN